MGHRVISSRTRGQISATAERSNRLRTRQLMRLSQLDCLKGVPPEELEYLVDLCVLRVFLAGETIISERKPEEFLFLVLEGNVCLTMHNKEGNQVLLGVLGPGDCCGEGMLFGDFSGRAGACAETDCSLLQLPTVEVRSLLTTCPHLSEALRRPHLHRLVEGTLAHGPLFSQVLPLERLSLAPLLEPVHYLRNRCIIHQGDQGQALYVIESGQVVVEQDGQVAAFLDEGDFFGEIALISQQPHSATVRTLTPTDVLCLPSKRFYEIMAQHPDFEAQLRSLAELRRMADRVRLEDEERRQRLELTLAHGLRRGSRLLVRSPGLCPPGCRLCEAACELRHGWSRLRLNGVLLGTQDVPDACRQCRVGAECIEACPEDAFEWRGGGMLVITERCTGCGACIPACPYQAITRVPRGARRPNGVIGGLLQALKNLPGVRNDDEDEGHFLPYTHRANKCDLCAGYEDMACLSACPTDSLHFIPSEEVVPL